MPTYTPAPAPTSTPVPEPIAVWGRKEISDIYISVKGNPSTALNRYIAQRVKIRGPISNPAYNTYNDFVSLRWPKIGAREPVFSVTCRLWNPSEELLDKINNLQDGLILDVEGDISELELFDDRIYDHMIVRLTNCVVYFPTYRVPDQ